MSVHSTSPLEIFVGERTGYSLRLIMAGSILAAMAFAIGMQILQPIEFGTAGVLGFCAVLGWMLYKGPLGDDINWTIRFGEILIERESIFGRKHVETIGIGEITDISLQKLSNEQGQCFYLDVRLQSSRHLISPYIATEDDAKIVEAGIRTWLQIATPS